MSFGSDNHAPVHPKIMAALQTANQGLAPSYGTDDLTAEAQKLLNQWLGKKASSYFVYNGTAANILALRSLTQGFHSVLCSQSSHLWNDEGIAPESVAQVKLIPIPDHHGKLQVRSLQKYLQRLGDQHYAQPKVLSLTVPTELGTCYSLEELKELTSFARAHQLWIHIDGARFANALHHLQISAADFFQQIPCDILSFGGTKNGWMFGETVVVFQAPDLYPIKFFRKQFMNLPSKTRYIAAQLQAYLQDDLWKEIAEHSCSMAQLLHQELQKIPGLHIPYPVQSNAVFLQLPQPWIKVLRSRHFFYVWDEETFLCRLMMNWTTTAESVHDFCRELRSLATKSAIDQSLVR